MSMIDKFIHAAEAELGYLEKKNNANLYEKTANAGSNNYTKYWQDILPSYQAQPWCAIFVTWCMKQAFGEENTKKLLGHYPYTYVPTLAGMFIKHANPQRGDIVCFYRNGEFVHTGIVTKVNGDYFETIEGNTSGGNSIVANGGAVCRKSYYNSALPGTKFIRPDYSMIKEEVVELKTVNDIVWELANRNIITDKELWLKKLLDDNNSYWLARKSLHYMRSNQL